MIKNRRREPRRDVKILSIRMLRIKDYVKKSKRGAFEQKAATVLPDRTAAT